MNRNLIRITIALLGLILVIVIVSGLSGERGAASQPDQTRAETEEPGPKFISHRVAEPLAESLTGTGWTVEDMQAAQPYPVKVNADEAAVSLGLSRPDGPPGVIASSPPGLDFSAAANSVEMLASAEITVVGYDYPPPYARYKNFDSYLTYPYSTVGVLFFKQDGISFRCSAASIGNYAIWTAGHCLHAGDGTPGSNDGTWSSEVIFAPAYDNGPSTLGVWTADKLWIPTQWHSSSSNDHRYDMGGVILNLNDGKKISQVVGSLGFAYNMNNNLHWMSIAYPLVVPFDGGSQQICAGSFAYQDTNPPGPPFPVAMGCDMTGGSSGGPWILNFGGSAGGNNLLNGNTSYRYGRPEEIFSPYFDSFALDFRNKLADEDPLSP